MTHDTSSGIPGSRAYRHRQRRQLLRFAQSSRCPEGFGYLDDEGQIDPTRPVELYVTCRMTHVFALGALAGEDPTPGGPGREALMALASHGVESLLEGPLHDGEHGGWFAAVHDGLIVDRSKQAYAHAFVVLAASTARTAGVPRADELLEEALRVQEEKFWDEAEGLVVEEWDASWTVLDPYRGLNSCMHTVEAYLAAGAALDDPTWFRRAERICLRVAGWARDNSWRIPEHFDAAWQPVLEHNRDEPAHPFRPYGATVGHGLEWARLMAMVHTVGHPTTIGLLEAAVRLADRAVADGWAVDGHDGFVYTTDWQGRPVVRARMHWVLAEAVATSTVLHWATGESRHAVDAERWWNFADVHLVDHEAGSWRHELAPDNTPAATTWPGRPDTYHAYQACLVADTLGAASFATGVERWGR